MQIGRTEDAKAKMQQNAKTNITNLQRKKGVRDEKSRSKRFRNFSGYILYFQGMKCKNFCQQKSQKNAKQKQQPHSKQCKLARNANNNNNAFAYLAPPALIEKVSPFRLGRDLPSHGRQSCAQTSHARHS